MINQLPNNQLAHEKAPDEWKLPLPGEKPLWFHRFCLYRDIGPKRSLKAALAKEQAQFTLLSAEQQAPEGHEKPEEKKVVHVPGSWKQASVSFHWKERCRSFDQAVIQTIAQDKLQHMGKSLANRFARIEQLSRMAEMIYRYINDEHNRRMLTQKEFIAYMRLLRDLMRDAKAEMSGIDDQALLPNVEWFTSACYFESDWTPENKPFVTTTDNASTKRPNFFQSVVEALVKVHQEMREAELQS